MDVVVTAIVDVIVDIVFVDVVVVVVDDVVDGPVVVDVAVVVVVDVDILGEVTVEVIVSGNVDILALFSLRLKGLGFHFILIFAKIDDFVTVVIGWSVVGVAVVAK